MVNFIKQKSSITISLFSSMLNSCLILFFNVLLVRWAFTIFILLAIYIVILLSPKKSTLNLLSIINELFPLN